MKVAKNKFFKYSGGMFEFENVSGVKANGLELVILLFGDHELVINSSEEMSSFYIWYEIFLQEKYEAEIEEEVEEEIGL